MADFQQQIERIERNVTKVAEWVTLIDLVFNGVIPRDHAETLETVQAGTPLEDNAEILLKRLSSVSIEVHQLTHALITTDGENISVEDDSPVFLLGADHAIS